MEGERQGGKVRGSRELEEVGKGGRNARMMGRKERGKRERETGMEECMGEGNAQEGRRERYERLSKACMTEG